ncbi:MAG: hypothetical protein ABIA37_02300 [Candidatus Woesearchaeota archaeon]
MTQLNLFSFKKNKNLTKEDRINITLSSSLKLKDCSDQEVLDVMSTILSHYVMGKGGIFYLKDEKCKNCKRKLKRKEVVQKVYHFPGGHQMVLNFMRYSCSHCKKTPQKPYEQVFERNKHYSSNVKNDSVEKYLNHLSSFSAVKKDINKEYSNKVSRKTIRRWISEIAEEARVFIFSNRGFSGHLVYDEEFMSIFEGDVGIKGATLTKKRMYFHLFRDAITDSVIVYLTNSLEKENLAKIWYECFVHLIKLGIIPLTISTDGLSDYSDVIKLVNKQLIREGLLTFEQVIKHTYCAFHFQKNTYENTKEHLFKSKFKRDELPEYAQNQIKELHKFFDVTNVEEAKEHLSLLFHQKQTLIEPVQKQIERLKKYFVEYTLHIQYPFLKTTNHAEQYFSNTKPEKIKKGYKTENGLKNIICNIAVKMMRKNWLSALGRRNDYSAAMKLFTRLVKGIEART